MDPNAARQLILFRAVRLLTFSCLFGKTYFPTGSILQQILSLFRRGNDIYAIARGSHAWLTPHNLVSQIFYSKGPVEFPK